jgi:hypothetical protein
MFTILQNHASPFGDTRAYETLFSNTGVHHDDSAHVYLGNVQQGILRLRLWPNIREADEEHISLPRQGNVRIEARFNKPLPEPVTCILYAEFPGHVDIDNSRKVTVEVIPLRPIVLSKHVKYFQGVHPKDLLPSTLI